MEQVRAAKGLTLVDAAVEPDAVEAAVREEEGSVRAETVCALPADTECRMYLAIPATRLRALHAARTW
jgi:hypothetical protein